MSYDLGEQSRAEYTAHRKKLDAAIIEQKERMAALERSGDNGATVEGTMTCEEIGMLKPLTDLRTLDRDTVKRLIHSILVYHDNRIEIRWDFDEDYMRTLTAKEETVMRDSG